MENSLRRKKQARSLQHSAENLETDVRQQMDANKKTLSNLVEKLWEKKYNKDLTQRSRIRFGRVTRPGKNVG